MAQKWTVSSGLCQNYQMASMGLAAALHFFPLICVTSDSLTLTYMAVGGIEDKSSFFLYPTQRKTICGQV